MVKFLYIHKMNNMEQFSAEYCVKNVNNVRKYI